MLINKFFELRDQTERMRLHLMELLKQEQPTYRNRLQEEIDQLKEVLDKAVVPELFRIAVVGTFKTGKSSFVNKLAEERLAGVETNPETAAISIFRYAEVPRAEVKLISLEDWQRMEDLFEDAPKHPEAYRVAGLKGFNEQMAQRKNREGQPVKFDTVDIDKLVKDWLKPNGHVHVIESEQWNTKKGKQAFRKAIREFTSSRNPLHYFVKELIVYAPVPLLRDHVELIDTPGLNDTQLYRGQLTEELLSQVDAILFLTRSGASFSQFDKEFLVRQLRKKRLRHLRLIITQVDNTYENARRDALEDDEDPPTFQEIKDKEESRLRNEIRRTLDELLEDTNLKEEEGYYYIEQLDALQIHFTSSAWFDDGKVNESGIPSVREALFEVLSENYHIQQLVDHLEHSLDAVRRRLRDFFTERRSFLETEFDLSRVENNIAKIESDLIVLMDRFQQTVGELKESHDREQDALIDLMEANIARMQLLAKEVLGDYEKTDISKHWKTRRHRYWGYLKDLGGRVADRVFPIMETTLNKQLRPFSDFIDLTSDSLDGLQSQIEFLEAESAVEGLPKIEFSATKQRFMDEYVSELQERVANEKDAIIRLLEEFSGELNEKLTGAKDEVADVWGTGTTVRQASIVAEFYDDVASGLTEALGIFLQRRLDAFRNALSNNAESLFPKLRASIEALLKTRKQAIEERLKFQTGEAKEQLEHYLSAGLSILAAEPRIGILSQATEKDTLEEREFSIAEGEIGFSYEYLFGPYLFNAEKIEIKEPYLRLRYQLENFQRFCELISRNGVTRQLELMTGLLDADDESFSDTRLEKIAGHLRQHGVVMNWRRDSSLHAREINTSNGWIILSDRGLDIYKRPESRNDFGHFDLALRPCKRTQIHIRRQLVTQ